MFRSIAFRSTLVVFALATAASAASAQVATRSAEEWQKTLDQPARIEGLRIDEVVGKLGLRPGQIVADLGAGTGVFAIPLAKAVAPGGTVYAVEIDKGYFPMIDRRAKEGGTTNVRTVLGEFTDPKLPGRDVDVAFMHDVLHHVQDRAGYLKNAATYLKPGGRFVIIDYRANQGPHGKEPDLVVSEDTVIGWMKAAGMGKVEKVEMFPDKYYLVFTR
jgi:ubiquinone/menaquinone biosynthesis C-methylase UbiE